MKQKIIFIIVVAMMGIIFIFSSCNADVSSMQSELIVKMLNNVLPVNSFFVRKFAHFSLFFTLELILYLLFKNIQKSFVVTIIYAILDEIHQYFVPGRSCELRDMIIDITGGLFAVLIIIIWRYIYVKRTRNNEKNS